MMMPNKTLRSRSAFALLTVSACGGLPDPTLGLTATEDPVVPDPTGEETETQTPTSGADECPGYYDTCVKYDPGAMKTLYHCLGANSFLLSASFNEEASPDLIDKFPRDRFFGFQSASPENKDVVACCSDEYTEGCGTLPAPQTLYCTLDCAQQSCYRILHELEVVIAELPYLFPETDSRSDLIARHNNLIAHFAECEKALYDRDGCAEIWANKVSMGENLPDVDTYCFSPFVMRARYSIPDDPNPVEGVAVTVEVECEINDWSPIDPPVQCDDNFDNNYDPFGGEIDPFEPFPIVPMEANNLKGSVIPELSPPLSKPASLSGQRLVFRNDATCESGCAFKLDELALSVAYYNVPTYKTSIVNLTTHIVRVANGVRNGNAVEFAAGEIALRVTATVESKDPVLDGVEIDSLALNDDVVTMSIVGDNVEIKKAAFVFGGVRFAVTVPPSKCHSL